MGTSLRIARVAGIDVFLHWTTILFFAWIAIADSARGDSPFPFRGLLFIVTTFTIIVLHELGHALMARRFGIPTKDITLLPIGGVARLQKIPEEPRQELLIALAGPAVNAALAIVIGSLILITRGVEGLSLTLVEAHWGSFVLWVNLGMGLFNLLPAFPMDGGRVLRALLATRIDYVRATEVAARIGQLLAVMLAILGFYTNGMLMLIALFIYIGAQQETVFAQVHSILSNVPAREAMRTHFMSLTPDSPLSKAFDEAIASSQHDFPVVGGDQTLCGMVYHADLLSALNHQPPFTTIADVMQHHCEVVQAEAMLEQVFERMNQLNRSTMPVVFRGHVIGLISLENIGEWMMLHSGHRRTSFGRFTPAETVNQRPTPRHHQSLSGKVTGEETQHGELLAR